METGPVQSNTREPISNQQVNASVHIDVFHWFGVEGGLKKPTDFLLSQHAGGQLALPEDGREACEMCCWSECVQSALW